MNMLVVFSYFGHGATPFLSLGMPVIHVQLSLGPTHVDLTIETHINGHTVRDVKMQLEAQDIKLVEARILQRLRNVDEDFLIVYCHHERIFEASYELILEAGFPFIFAFDENCALPWTQFHFVGSARDRICFSEDHKAAFRRTYLYNCTAMAPEVPAALIERLERCASRERLRPLTKPSGTKGMNVLFLSYYYKPALSVAIHRVDYWQAHIAEVARRTFGASAPEIQTQVMTACESYENDRQALVVPDLGELRVNDDGIRVLKTRLQAARVNWISVYWEAHVKAWLDNHPDAHFDAVVMSGNPFFYFGLTHEFKKRFGAQVILDFRDPFSSNPRFIYSPAHKVLLEELEDEYLDASDASLSVNDLCRQSLRLDNKHVSELVPNGFDESVVDDIPAATIPGPANKIRFIYAGKFYGDRDATTFVSGLDPKQHRLLHIGWESETDDHLDEYPAMERLGVMPYVDVVAHCKSSQAGVIFASGDAFEQTTKIFDYIAADIDIVIVTEGVTHYGNLHTMTEALDGVYWVRNSEKAIAAFLDNYEPRKRKRPQRNRFSRGHAARTLVRLLVEGPNARSPRNLKSETKAKGNKA